MTVSIGLAGSVSTRVARALAVGLLIAAWACGARHRIRSPLTLHGEVSDAIGDAQPNPVVATPPDLREAIVDVVDGRATFTVHFTAGSFDPGSTRITIQLDTDQNQSTGISTATGLGIDYIVDMWAATRRALVLRAATGPPPACNPCDYGESAAAVNVDSSGMTTTIPLSLIGSVYRPMNFRVVAYSMKPGVPSGQPTIVSDTMPNPELPPGHIDVRPRP